VAEFHFDAVRKPGSFVTGTHWFKPGDGGAGGRFVLSQPDVVVLRSRLRRKAQQDMGSRGAAELAFELSEELRGPQQLLDGSQEEPGICSLDGAVIVG
jgi:hypothetical protein